ncbi:MAG: bifunctional enoyl-CoA hydratase/phosphate acetyltransferase [Thermovirga sp.]|nr:bifunctional enoyl-CoA hydratase/phosphate acetyltransferase [Thermovirga sp.]
MSFKDLEFLISESKAGRKMRLAVAAAQGVDVLEAVWDAAKEGVVEPVLFGDLGKIGAIAAELGIDLSDFAKVPCSSEKDAAEKAVKAVSSGEADLLMKGNVKTATLLKAVLNKEWGLRTGAILSHLFLFYIPKLGRVVSLTDGGMTMYPDLNTKKALIENSVSCYRKLGVECPKVAVLAAVEVVNPDMPCTLDAAALKQMNVRGQIKNCIVDGPLALDNAISEESAKHKGIVSEVAGKADILLVPDIEAGNMMGKVMMYMSGGVGAGVILGAKTPVVLTSRFDSAATKLRSIALGAVLASKI